MPKSVLTTDRLMKPIAHFSHGARVGQTIHIGAEAGTDAQQRLAGATPGIADIGAQTERLLENFAIVLEGLGGSLADVVRMRAFLVDWRDAGGYAKVFARRFGAKPPSTVTLGSWGFPLRHAVVEAELIALVGGVRDGRFWTTASPTGVGDAGTQSDEALGRLGAALADAGLRPRDVVMVNASLADLRHYAAFDAAYRRFFRVPGPARSVVATSLRHPAQLVEIEATAVRGGGAPVFAGPAADVAPAVLAGDELYIGGVCAGGRDAQEQMHAAWRRVQTLVEEAGMTLADVVRTCNVLTDWRDYGAYNAGYGRFVTAPYPPRATLLGGLVDPCAKVQIEAMAHREGHQATVLEANPP